MVCGAVEKRLLTYVRSLLECQPGAWRSLSTAFKVIGIYAAAAACCQNYQRRKSIAGRCHRDNYSFVLNRELRLFVCQLVQYSTGGGVRWLEAHLVASDAKQTAPNNDATLF